MILLIITVRAFSVFVTFLWLEMVGVSKVFLLKNLIIIELDIQCIWELRREWKSLFEVLQQWLMAIKFDLWSRKDLVVQDLSVIMI